MDDHRLVKECLRGKAVAQRQLYDRFAPALLAVCYRYTKSVADAEDVLQEGFVKAFKNLQQFKGEGELGAWLRRIMVTTAINYLKKASRYQAEMLFGDEQLHVVSSYQPQLNLEAKELADLIRQLPAGYQFTRSGRLQPCGDRAAARHQRKHLPKPVCAGAGIADPLD